MEEDYGKAMEEVMRGCEFADQLRQVLLLNNDLTTTTTSIFVQNLVNNVINSFNNILFLLDKNKHIPPTTDQMENNFSSIASSVDFKESFMGTSAAGRCYERRNTTLTSEKVTKSPTEDDGHRWRKYGQKKITNSHYTRNYYRCTHKYDQRCLATKQVHRIQQNPPLYKTTYYGHHTCGNLSYPDSILDPNDTSSILLSFNNTFPTPTKQECPILASSSSLSSSHNSLDHKEEVPASSLEDSNLLSHDFTLDNSISTFDSCHKDMLYDFLYDSVEFDDHFFRPFDGH